MRTDRDGIPVGGLLRIGGWVSDRVDRRLLGGAAFFYFWWVATLLFDLVFIWHRYIRHAAALESVAEITNKGYVPSKLEARIGRKRSATPTHTPA